MLQNVTTVDAPAPIRERVSSRLMPVDYFLKKRLVDLFILALFAPLYLPIMLALGMVVKASSTGPIFYGQTRLGLGGRAFKAWKFRTMIPNADQVLKDYLDANPSLREEWERDHKLRNDPRITPIGRFLRKSSLDELPQLWNVFVGEMSLVGPRPIVREEVKKYEDKFEDYRQVMPGITGLWQVSGRNNTTYEERVALDSKYVNNWSIGWDIWILFRTVKTVLLREGAF